MRDLSYKDMIRVVASSISVSNMIVRRNMNSRNECHGIKKVGLLCMH